MMLTPIKFHRLAKGIKASDLAKKVSISVSLLSKIETGKFRGSKKTRLKIAKAMGMSEIELFGIK